MGDAELARKVAAVFEPMLKAVEERLTNKAEANTEELNASITALSAKVDLLEKSVSEPKKKAVKTPKAAPPSQAAINKAIEDGVVIMQADGSTNGNKIEGNKRLYFIAEFKRNEAFKNKYYTDEIKAKAEIDPSVTKTGNKPTSKLHAIAVFTYKYISDGMPNVMLNIEKDYNDAKKTHEEKNKQPQQTVDNTA